MTSLSPTESRIRVSDIQRLNEVFSKNSWLVHVADKSEFNYENLFNDFCELLSTLEVEEVDLIIRLTQDFLHFPYTAYPRLMRDAFLSIPDEYIERSDSIFLIPLIKPSDVGNTKSSTGALYSWTHVVIPQINPILQKHIASYENPDLLRSKYPNRKNSLIIIIDDYIGSGGTAIDGLQYYNNEIRVSSDVAIVVSLVAQLQGLETIRHFGFSAYSSVIRGRGISDSSEIVDKKAALAIMKKIENRMKVRRDFRFGYKGSEALVSMMRTPNNTFPFYWWKKNTNGQSWNGLFNR